MNDKLEAMLKATNHLTSAVRFHHDQQRNDTDYELKAAIKQIADHLDKVEVDFNA